MAWVKLKRGATLPEEDVKNFCKGQIANFRDSPLCALCGFFSHDRLRQLQKFPYARFLARISSESHGRHGHRLESKAVIGFHRLTKSVIPSEARNPLPRVLAEKHRSPTCGKSSNPVI